MPDSLLASQQALDDLVDSARVRRRWNKHDERWATAADVSLKTLQRFWSRKPIRRANFIAICQAIDIEDWRAIADLPSQQEPQYQSFFYTGSSPSEKPGISISIEGADSVLLGKTAYYTVISQNAVRGVWSIGGFQNEPIDVDPLDPSHQIFIEPTDATRVGETFTIAFTAYDASGKSEIAIKRFTVASATEAAASLHTSESPRRLSTFLCHSSGDKEAVRQLYEKLRSDGVDPWLDEKNLLPGQDWHEEITRAVRTVDVVIVCLSRESINKRGYVQKEIKNALDVADEQPEGTIFIIPLRLEECELPQRLSRWHYVNFFEVDGYKRLMLALQYCAIKMGIMLSVDPSEDELMQFYQEKFEEVFTKTFGENHTKLNSKSKGKIVISFTGVSGVGRTSTINALMKHNVAPVDKFIVTTEQVELYQWLNGENKVYIADIPRLEYGIGELEYSDHVQEFLKDNTDVIIFFMSPFQRISKVELRYLEYFAESDKPKIIAVNQIDRVSSNQLMDYLGFVEEKTGYTPVPISAFNNQNIDLLREFLMKVIQLYST
ncbi:MAG: TIR domain-containing protein [Phormidesmis sp.]